MVRKVGGEGLTLICFEEQGSEALEDECEGDGESEGGGAGEGEGGFPSARVG